MSHKSRRIRKFDGVPVSSQPADDFKPGGLWFACGDAWERWIKDNEFDEFNDFKYRYVYTFELDDSRVLTLKTPWDLLMFYVRFAAKPEKLDELVIILQLCVLLYAAKRGPAPQCRFAMGMVAQRVDETSVTSAAGEVDVAWYRRCWERMVPKLETDLGVQLNERQRRVEKPEGGVVWRKHAPTRNAGSFRSLINWQSVAANYGGVVICPYQKDCVHLHWWYSIWDVASGCVWDPAALRSHVEVSRVPRPPARPSDSPTRRT